MHHEVLVRSYHVDGYLHVNNSRYLEFFEEGRWRWLDRENRLEWLKERNIGFYMVNININYRKGAVEGDLLRIESLVYSLKGRSGKFKQVMKRLSDGAVIADADMTFVCVDMEVQKALPMEGELKDKLESLGN
ncbi:thioesterase family protein [Yersinia nurmii]|uniref:4-hydroxybenzoyl-CoA thioesterase n=1 Tax=Yersinia nurmii TaxID=685706 RepID=A0AAW7K991_9GAMM|nr:thioesterase family protein [Yersinia nurmii]MDN0088006.1 thioesterase family protein [Yersinia nurmii]CNE65663.1 4-hydroxybenzoyl-CoA thioesterase [Yersinia nurmii]